MGEALRIAEETGTLKDPVTDAVDAHLLYPKSLNEYTHHTPRAWHLAGGIVNAQATSPDVPVSQGLKYAADALSRVDRIADRVTLLRHTIDGTTPPAPAHHTQPRYNIVIPTHDPLVTKYMQIRTASTAQGKPFRNTLPWHALAEQLSVADWIAAAGDVVLTSHDLDTGHEHKQVAVTPRALANVIRGAVTYLWRTDMEKIAHSCPLPSHIVHREALPHPAMFWSRETGNEAGNALDWFFVFTNNTHMIALTNIIRPDEPGGQTLFGITVRYGARYPEDLLAAGSGPDTPDRGSQAQFNMTTMILQGLAFLNSDYTQEVVTRPATPGTPDSIPHAARKQYRKHNIPLPTSLVSVIKLRERRYTPDTQDPDAQDVPTRDPVQGGSEPSRHYAVQFWVRGHMRNQAHGPNRTLRTPKWIAPYLKGPENAPIKLRVYDVKQ